MSAGNILERDCDTRIAQLEAQLAEARKALSAVALYDCDAWAVGGKCNGCPACIADKALGREIEQ